MKGESQLLTVYIHSKYFRIICILFRNESSSYTKITEADKLLQLSDSYLYKNTPQSIIYAHKARIIAEGIGDSKRKAESYYYIARGLIFLRQLEEAYSYIEKE